MMDPLGDGKSRIKLIDYMGGDLSVVNDARASFEKESNELTEKDVKLIRYLVRHEHTSPLRGTVFKFKVKAPLFVCRQWWKHVIASNHNDEQLGWNEKSFRYTEVEDSDEFYVPTSFRAQSTSNKQSTDGEIVSQEYALQIYKRACNDSFIAYTDLLALGVGREQARGVLAPAVYTSWVWTASLQSTLHFINLRMGKGAQDEITRYAEAIYQLVLPIIPETINAFEFKGVFHENH